MHRWGWLLLIGMSLLGAGTARAGIYNPGEWEEGATWPDFMNSPTGRDFRDVLIRLQSIPVELPQIDNPVRRRYVFEEELYRNSPSARLKTTADYLQASAVLLRRRKFEDTELLLRPIATRPEERDNLPLQSNFATALHRVGKLQDAVYTLRPVVRDYWKKPWDELPEARQKFYKSIGWTDALYDLYREYDRYYLKLLQLRLREQLTKKERKGVLQPPDALFDDGKDPPAPVRFVSEAGDFEAGKLAAAERAKLPPTALPIVQQLLVWLPDDPRLYWLLGELYNVQEHSGDKENKAGIRAALRIFSELSNEKSIADEAKEMLKKRVGVLTAADERFRREEEKGLSVGLQTAEKRDSENAPPFDWNTAAISFGAGFVMAIFVIWQVREIQRRRHARLANQKVRLDS